MPAPFITRTTKRKDPTGLLSKKLIEDGSLHKIYELAATSELSYIRITIINLVPTESLATHDFKIKLWIADTDTDPTDIDLIEPLLSFKTNDIYISEGRYLSYNEAIYLQVENPEVSPKFVIRVEGFENVIPI